MARRKRLFATVADLGLRRPWLVLSIIAIVEGFGGEVLRTVALPPLGERVVDPIEGTALAHLNVNPLERPIVDVGL